MSTQIIINLILITVITVNIVDISGVVNSIKEGLKQYLKINNIKSLKPFECSYCMAHHINLLYLFITDNLTLQYYLIVLLLSFLTTTILQFQLLVKTTIDNLLTYIENKLN